jgi:hypothetical protein
LGWGLRLTVVGLVALLALPDQPAMAQSFFQSLFGSGPPSPPQRAVPGPGGPRSPYGSPFGSPFSPYVPNTGDSPSLDTAGTYRTLCVRLCDGFYFPIGFATRRGGLTRDADKCESSCGGQARLFYHPNPGGDIETMVDLTGRAYAALPTAFKYRKTLVAGCRCRPQPWSEAELARHRAYAQAGSGAGGEALMQPPGESKASAALRQLVESDRGDAALIDRKALETLEPNPRTQLPRPVETVQRVVARPRPVAQQAQSSLGPAPYGSGHSWFARPANPSRY